MLLLLLLLKSKKTRGSEIGVLNSSRNRNKILKPKKKRKENDLNFESEKYERRDRCNC